MRPIKAANHIAKLRDIKSEKHGRATGFFLYFRNIASSRVKDLDTIITRITEGLIKIIIPNDQDQPSGFVEF